MRAREFVREGRTPMNADHQAASPGAVSYPTADNPYLKYRLGMAAAGSPDNEHPFELNGPSAGDMVSSHYTSADEEIMHCAYTRMGFNPAPLAARGSKESKHTNTVSPTSNWNTK